MERILYIWSIRHPASGYVQGINDLTTPFFVVFLSDECKIPSTLLTTVKETVEGVVEYDSTQISEELIARVEADTYWCFSKLLDGIQDNYTFSQPGIQRMIYKLRELIFRVDGFCID